MFAPRRIAQEMHVVADALRRVAVVANTIYLTWSLDIETGGIGGRSRATRSGQRSLDSLRHLVHANDGVGG